jgi:4-diphosphocytidyl-2C-methyl-D-erythritol kinase
MSGSGSSVFGLTDDRTVAEAAVMGFSPDTITSVTPPLI